MPRFLHVANGTSTTATIEAAGIPGIRSIWADPLYEGPVPAGLTDEELIDGRSRYLAGPANGSEIDPVNDLRNWRAVISDHQSYDEVVLWFEHDLFDQLNLIQILTWIREHVPSAKPVSLVCIGSFPGRPAFKGLGELAPNELAPLVDARQRVSAAQYALAERAWLAFRQATPGPLDELRHTDTASLPFLGRALTRFLQEYPWTRDGLSRTERRLLELARAGDVDLLAAFPRMHDHEVAYYVTDASLLALAEALARTSPPLIVVGPDSGRDEPFRRTVTLTDAGRTVLAGHQDRIAICGIDRWLGGVHLQNGAPIWRWDDAGQRITRR